jgi:tetratricopeptide (TPR) repeat protein
VLAAGAIGIAAWAAYANTFSVPFVFDDKLAIVDNPSIRDLANWRAVFSPPPGTAGAVGRPLVNLTLALNYAIGGLDVRGYHAVNLLIHALTGLTLFGFIHRTLRLPAVREKFAGHVLPLAATIALLWTVHPLQTETVTCVIQRNESLASLWMLLTLYGFVRSLDSPRPVPWRAVAVLANLLGVAAKEITVVTPLLVLLFDRAFVAGSFRAAWQQRRSLYGGLAASWLLLGWLVAGAHSRNDTVGFGQGLGPLDYALTQCWAVPHYLALSFWPTPLVVDFGTTVVTSIREVAPSAAVLAVLLGGSVWALARRPAIGFVAAGFFLILAPSSSVFPLVTQTVAEHRMYLPLAAVIALVVLGVQSRAGKNGWLLFLPLAGALGFVTFLRNADYRSELSLWRDTVAQRPANARAHNNLANALEHAGDHAGALEHYAQAVRLKPDFATARANLANALLAADRVDEALLHYNAAVRLDPRAADVWHNRGNALARAGRPVEAVENYRQALSLGTNSAEVHRGLANVLAQTGRFAEARTHYEIALRDEPGSAALHGNLGNALFSLGEFAAARAHYETALRLDPRDADAHNNYGTLLLAQQNPRAALREFEEAVRLRPDFPTAKSNLEHTRQLLALPN